MDFLIIQGETQGRLQQIRTFPLVLWSIPSVNKWANALVLPTLFLSQGRGHAVCGRVLQVHATHLVFAAVVSDGAVVTYSSREILTLVVTAPQSQISSEMCVCNSFAFAAILANGEAVSRAYVAAARADFGSKTGPGQPRNIFESRNRSSLHGLFRRSRLLWRRPAARATLVLAAGPTSPLGLVLAVLAEEGHGLS